MADEGDGADAGDGVRAGAGAGDSGETETAGSGQSDADSRSGSDGRRRAVEVPPELFRVVVVFSTVLSLATVVLGFVLLDAATRVVENPTGSAVVDLVRLVSGRSVAALEPHLGTIALAVGLAGLGAIGLGAWIYAVGTRFRTGGMETHNNATDEGSDDG